MKYLSGLNRKSAIVAGSVLIIGAATGAAALTSSNPVSATDTTPTEQQVDKNTQELANHEARITNAENNITDLQKNTDTAPSSSNVSVPEVTSTTTVTTPTPVPVTVTAYEKIPLDAINIDCRYTYSDGTTYQWHWQTAGQDAWIADAFGQNGHWVHTTQTSGLCDKSIIGQAKS